MPDIPFSCPYCGGTVPETTAICPDCHEDLSALLRLEYSHVIYYNEALALARDGYLDDARARLIVALERKESFAPAHALLAKVYAHQRQWARAEASAARALELDPENPAVRRLADAIGERVTPTAGTGAARARVAPRREVSQVFKAGVGLATAAAVVLSLFTDDD
jgi:tetratricopeptide (TPR) repeat protein